MQQRKSALWYNIDLNLNIIHLSLLTGYVPQSIKLAVIKPLPQKSTLDPEVSANHRPISNIPILSKTLESVVANQESGFLRVTMGFTKFFSQTLNFIIVLRQQWSKL